MEGEPVERRRSTEGEAYDDCGVDLTLIRESLARAPVERLDLADAYAQEIETLRSYVREA